MVLGHPKLRFWDAPTRPFGTSQTTLLGHPKTPSSDTPTLACTGLGSEVLDLGVAFGRHLEAGREIQIAEMPQKGHVNQAVIYISYLVLLHSVTAGKVSVYIHSACTARNRHQTLLVLREGGPAGSAGSTRAQMPGEGPSAWFLRQFLAISVAAC